MNSDANENILKVKNELTGAIKRRNSRRFVKNDAMIILKTGHKVNFNCEKSYEINNG